MRFLWVGVAGALGAIVRYAIGLSIDQWFPWATLGINVSGALLLGFFLAVALGRLPVSVSRRRRRRRPCPSLCDRRAREWLRRRDRAGTSRTRVGVACRRATTPRAPRRSGGGARAPVRRTRPRRPRRCRSL